MFSIIQRVAMFDGIDQGFLEGQVDAKNVVL